VNRLKIRLSALAVIGLVALIAPVLSGCGAGQIAQTANQEPAVNGNRVTIGKTVAVGNTTVNHKVELRDIRIQAGQTGDYIEPGRTVELVMVVVNQSPDIEDRLVDIKTDIGTVAISGDPRLQPSGMLFVGTPDGAKVAPGPIGISNLARAIVTVTKPPGITNGLTYKFTFVFEKAGEAKDVVVPVSAGLAPARA